MNLSEDSNSIHYVYSAKLILLQPLILHLLRVTNIFIRQWSQLPAGPTLQELERLCKFTYPYIDHTFQENDILVNLEFKDWSSLLVSRAFPELERNNQSVLFMNGLITHDLESAMDRAFTIPVGAYKLSKYIHADREDARDLLNRIRLIIDPATGVEEAMKASLGYSTPRFKRQFIKHSTNSWLTFDETEAHLIKRP